MICLLGMSKERGYVLIGCRGVSQQTVENLLCSIFLSAIAAAACHYGQSNIARSSRRRFFPVRIPVAFLDRRYPEVPYCALRSGFASMELWISMNGWSGTMASKISNAKSSFNPSF